jgi:uncharacterized coiled-coil DUF342 family protein
MNNDAIIDTLLARVRTLEDEREHARKDLGATDREGLRDAAQRVVRERDEARQQLADEKLESASWRAKTRDKGHSAREVAKERDKARTEVERLRAERDDARVCLKFAEAVRDAVIQESERAEQERDEARRALGEILAVIHRDGGHHTGEHGITQSVADAHATWAAMVQERDGARDDAERIRRKAITAQSERDHALVEFMLLQSRFREVERERDALAQELARSNEND